MECTLFICRADPLSVSEKNCYVIELAVVFNIQVWHIETTPDSHLDFPENNDIQSTSSFTNKAKL